MKHFITLTSAGLLAVVTGCSTERIADYQAAAPSTSEHSVQTSGVEVAADPFVDKERAEQYFDIDAASEGIGIVHVRVVNHTANQTFLVQKKNFQLLLAGKTSGQTADGQEIDRSTSGGQAVALTGAVVGSVGGLAIMLVGSSMISHSMEVQRNFVGKELPDQTLAPGERMDGFIYYPLAAKDAGWVHGAALKVTLPETQSHGKVATAIPLSQ